MFIIFACFIFCSLSIDLKSVAEPMGHQSLLIVLRVGDRGQDSRPFASLDRYYAADRDRSNRQRTERF